MSPSSGAPVLPPELVALEQRLGDLAAGDPHALRELRPALHRIVVASAISGAVKTLVVHALLLLDDPRLQSQTNAAGAPLLLKLRKLLESALAAHADGAHAAAVAVPRVRVEFSPDALLTPETDPALVDEFVVEAREQLAIAESALLVLDTFPDDMESVGTMFRAVHSIKGTSAFLGVEHATALAHHAEALLSRIRVGGTRCEGAVSNLLFRSIDMLDAMLVAIESAADGDAAMLPDGFRELLSTLEKEAVPVGGERVVPIGMPSAWSGASATRRRRPRTVRVRAPDLTRLSDLMDELTLAHAMLARDPALRASTNAELARKIAHAESIAGELQAVVTELHTVPFSVASQRLARLARDVAAQSGKAIEFATRGDDLSIERATADAIVDPLMHMIRNAVDHGIETAAARERAGKPRVGHIRLSAQRQNDELVIALSDDGRGLDPERLLRTAIERGLLPPNVELTDDEVFSLILRPGFTTNVVVTDLSGRGVGMDVVRASVDALGGSIDIDSRLGEGTTFTIRLPFRSAPAATGETRGEPSRTIGLIA